MELDEMKEMWSDVGKKQARTSEDELLAILQKKSKSPIAKMKRNLTWELILLIVISSSVFFVRDEKKILVPYTFLLLIIGILFGIYFYFKYRLLHSMECVTCEVKSNLRMQLIKLEKYVRNYFIYGTLLTPVVFFVTGIVMYIQLGGKLTISPILFWIIFSIIGIVFSVFIYFINKYYLHKLYGQHIQKLKDILHEMEETEIK